MASAGPGTMFLVTLAYFVVLAGLGVGYLVHRDGPRWSVPEIAWCAALGGAVASLHAIYRDVTKWNPAHNLAYLVRPMTAGVVGTVGYLIYLVLAKASVEPAQVTIPKAPPVLSLMIAFTLGYREETFRHLLQRIVDLLATVGGADTEPPSAPQSFRCTARDGTVRLTWTEATDNVAVIGYNIYRDYRFLAAVRVNLEARRAHDSSLAGSESGADSHGLHSTATEMHRLSFEDLEVEPGRHRYSVTAVDGAGNESEAVGPKVVTVRLNDPSPDGEDLTT